VFEAGRFSRVRVLPADEPRRYALRILDIRAGDVTAEVPLPAAPYRALRACACGGHLAAGTDDAVVLVDLRTGHTHSLAHSADFSWVSRGATEFLVTVLSTQDGTEIRACTPDGSRPRVVEVRPEVVLDHVFTPPAPCLLLGDPGTGAATHLVLVGFGAGGLSAPSWRIRGRPLVHGRVALVDRSTGPLRVAAVETHRAGSRVRLLTEPTTGTLRADPRWADATGQGLLDVVDWTAGTVHLTGPSRVVQLRAVRHQPAAAEPRVPARDGGARVWLHPPTDGKPPAATVVSLLPRLVGPGGPRRHGLLTEHVHRLTRLGFAVAAVDVPLRWWPDVPDEQLRPTIVSTIAAAVTESALEGPLVVLGHSFAATLALQALADTDLFAAAMVSAGGYCRTLTPLGFQYEKRTLWEAPRVYQDFDAVLSAPESVARSSSCTANRTATPPPHQNRRSSCSSPSPPSAPPAAWSSSRTTATTYTPATARPPCYANKPPGCTDGQQVSLPSYNETWTGRRAAVIRHPPRPGSRPERGTHRQHAHLPCRDHAVRGALTRSAVWFAMCRSSESVVWSCGCVERYNCGPGAAVGCRSSTAAGRTGRVGCGLHHQLDVAATAITALHHDNSLLREELESAARSSTWAPAVPHERRAMRPRRMIPGTSDDGGRLG
jgi:hypothetical protein